MVCHPSTPQQVVPIPTLAAIEMFRAVAEYGSFTKAASHSGVSRTRASNLISDLEAELGVRLLERTTRQVSVTEAGQAYLEQASPALDLLDDATNIVADYSDQPRGTLRISAPVSFGIRHFGPLIAAYRQANPLVQVELSLEDRTVDLMTEAFDIAVRIGDLVDSSLIARRIAPIKRVLCAAPSYLAGHGTPQTPQDLARHDCMGYRYMAEGSDWALSRVDGADELQTVRVTGSIRTNNGDVVCQMAVMGQGIASLPTFICGADLAAGNLVRVLPDYEPPEQSMYALHLGNRHVAPKIRAFIDHLAASFQKHQPWSDGCTARQTRAEQVSRD